MGIGSNKGESRLRGFLHHSPREPVRISPLSPFILEASIKEYRLHSPSRPIRWPHPYGLSPEQLHERISGAQELFTRASFITSFEAFPMATSFATFRQRAAISRSKFEPLLPACIPDDFINRFLSVGKGMIL